MRVVVKQHFKELNRESANIFDDPFRVIFTFDGVESSRSRAWELEVPITVTVSWSDVDGRLHITADSNIVIHPRADNCVDLMVTND